MNAEQLIDHYLGESDPSEGPSGASFWLLRYLARKLGANSTGWMNYGDYDFRATFRKKERAERFANLYDVKKHLKVDGPNPTKMRGELEVLVQIDPEA